MAAIEIVSRTPYQTRAIRLWLYAVAALVLAMVLVGGATRLTESGLSITEWQPVMGVRAATQRARNGRPNSKNIRPFRNTASSIAA